MLKYHYFFKKKKTFFFFKSNLSYLERLFFFKKKFNYLITSTLKFNLNRVSFSINFFINKKVFFKKNKKNKIQYLKFFFFKKSNEFKTLKYGFLDSKILKCSFVFFLKKKNQKMDDFILKLTLC